MWLKIMGTSAVVSLVVVFGYHVLVVAPDQLALERDHALEIERLQASARDGDGDPLGLGGPEAGAGSTSITERLEELESRVQALSPQAPSAPTPRTAAASDPGAVPPVIAAARTKARQAQRDRDVDRYRTDLRRRDPRLADSDLEQAARLMADHAEAVRQLYAGQEQATPEEREGLRGRYEALRAELRSELSRYVDPGALTSALGEARSE